MKILFSPPDISQLEIDEVVDTLKSGWITTGPKTKELERQLSAYYHTNQSACLNSATAASEMALRLLGIGPGDEVITTAYTYTASASVIAHVGATIRMVDTQAGSFFMDLDALEKAINPKTKAIIPVDIGGVPCDYEGIFDVVNRKKDRFVPNSPIQEALGRVAVVADSAHALGAWYKGTPCGAIADFTSFSFHAVKNFTTGEGGSLTWLPIEGIDDREIYQNLQLLSLHGQSKDALAKSRIGDWEYDIIAPYYKCNMTDIAASLGLAQLKRYPDLLKRRAQMIRMYNKGFEGTNITPIDHFSDDYTSSYHLYVVHIGGADETARNEVIVEMAKRGVATNVHYKPLPMHTAYKKYGFDIADFPNAYNQYKNAMTLPLHTLLTDEEVAYIIENLVEIVG